MVLRCNISPVSLYPHATQERLAKGAGHAVMALLMLLATAAAAEWGLPCLFWSPWRLFDRNTAVAGYAHDRCVLNPQAALVEVNAFVQNMGLMRSS